MSNSIDQSFNDFVNGFAVNNSLDFSSFSNISQGQYLDFADIVTLTPVPLEIGNRHLDSRTPSGFSPENSSNSNHHWSMNLVSEAVAMPTDTHSKDACLKVIAQPSYGTRLRYRSDFDNNDSRLGVLKNRTINSNYQGPAIQIPPCYLQPNDEYYVRVCLVTDIYDKTNLRYFHPYILEDPLNEQLNHRWNNSICFPIQGEDRIVGIKSFPSIRMVKQRASDLKNYGNLRVFDSYSEDLQRNHTLPQLSSPKETIKGFNLETSQLAFTIAKQVIRDGQTIIVPYPDTTVFSDEMIEGVSNELDGDNDIQAPNGRSKPSPPSCRVYKYAPRYGFDTSNEDMVIFLTHKLEPKTYGPLQVTFECDIPNGRWSQSVTDLDIKDRMVSFKTPFFPYQVDKAKSVDVKLQQTSRVLGTINYFYISSFEQCSRCQLYAIGNPTNTIPNIPNKRSIPLAGMDDSEFDGVTLISENSHELQQSLSEPAQESSPASTGVSKFASLPPIHIAPTTNNPNEELMTVLATSVESLFINNDYTQLLRICRSFIKKRPQALHDAVTNNHIDLLLKFLPLASIDILQKKNEVGETILLHAIRLNRIEIIKVLLEKKDSKQLIEDIDEKKNNIFHFIASYSTSSEILDLIINDLLQKSIPIQEKFDQINHNGYTPLQLTISKNNLLITKYFLKYFNTNVHETKNLTGDNLIHLAVRYGDLEMVKYLIEEGKLIQQGNQCNLTMTPTELAQSLKRQDLMEYLNEKYPREQFDEDSSSSSDEDD